MVTVWRTQGLRFVIFLDDHEPAHVHVFGDGEIKINLTGRNDEPELVWAFAMKHGDIRKAMRIVGEHRETFLARWRAIHG